MKKFVFILLFIGMVVHATYAAPHLTRTYASRYFTTRDGLAQMQVTCAFQDRDGYMWFGTKGGVSRWDGVSFKTYNQDNGLPKGTVTAINQWGDRIVVGYIRCFVIIYPDDRLRIVRLPACMFFGRCLYNVIDSNQLLFHFIFTDGKQAARPQSWLYRLKEKKLSRIYRSSINVGAIHNDTILSQQGVYLQKKLRLIKLASFQDNCDDIHTNGTISDFIIRTENGYYIKYQLRRGHLKSMWSKKADQTKSVIYDNILTEANRKLYNYPDTTLSYGDITTPSLTYLDRDKNLWLLTDNGLYNFYGCNIQEYRFGLGNPDNVWSVVEDGQRNIWLGSYSNGLWKFTPSAQLIPTEQYNLSILQYMGSTRTPAGEVLMTYAKGVARFANGKLKHKYLTGVSLFCYYDKATKSIYSSGMDTIRDIHGLSVIDSVGNIRFFPWTKGFPLTILRDVHGLIRIGGGRGMATFKGNKIINAPASPMYQGVVCMVPDKQGCLWKGTENGIFVEEPNGKEYRVGGKRLNGSCLSMLNWKNRYMVIGMNKSIVIVPLYQHAAWKEYTFGEFGFESGFTGLESGQNGICVDHNEDVWLSTALCVLKFNPENLMKWKATTTPKLRISDIAYSSDNAGWNRHFFNNNQKIEIQPNNHFFKINYISVSLSAPEKLTFRYRLIGFNNNWSQPTQDRQAYYTSLPYGTYHFELQNSMDGEHWSATVRSPEIVVLAPLWLRWYMILLYNMSMLSAILFVSRWFLKRKELKRLDIINRQKLENELQLNTLRSKVIPHFTKNVLSAIGHFAMTDKLKAGHYIAVFSRFTQLTLSNADKNFILLEDEINYLQTYLELEKMRFGSRFEYKIDISLVLKKNIYIPSMTLHTYCDNAIRHGLVHKNGDGILSIDIHPSDSGIVIRVKDNGIGRVKAQELGTRGNGQGLKLIEQQISFYNQKNKFKMTQTITDLYDKNNVSVGTQIELFVPDIYYFE